MKSRNNKVSKNTDGNGIRIEMVYPFKRQIYSYDCGAACMETVLTYFGYDAREDHIMRIAGTDKGGTSIDGLIKVAKKFGIKYKVCENMTIDNLKKCINHRRPCITPVQAWGNNARENWEDDWRYGHYVVPIAYDNRNLYFEDPASEKRTFLSCEEMERRWHDKDTSGKKLIHVGIMFYGKPERFDDDDMIHMD
jgi:predicted double-glycine peptidase